MDYVLKTSALNKTYGRFKALDGLSMSVPKGAIYGFVGKNGAGKTTLIRLICGLQEPTSGSYTLYGRDNNDKEVEKSRRRMGAVVEIPSIYLDMTAEDNLKQGITPIIRMPEEHVTRKADKAALSRVFSNLLNNAIKYSDGDLEITLSETGEISFVNTASGLNEVQVGKLFDRFYTVETAESFTGLGLSIAKTLVRQMNGTITSGYENGKLTICIVLPDVK